MLFFQKPLQANNRIQFYNNLRSTLREAFPQWHRYVFDYYSTTSILDKKCKGYPTERNAVMRILGMLNSLKIINN